MLTALFFASIWLGVMVLFIVVMHAKVIVAEQELTLFWKVHLYPLAAVGILLDWVFNWSFGVVMFAELPPITWEPVGRFSLPIPELLFSSRVGRHVEHSSGWRLKLALFWARQLNQIDPGHIRTRFALR